MQQSRVKATNTKMIIITAQSMQQSRVNTKIIIMNTKIIQQSRVKATNTKIIIMITQSICNIVIAQSMQQSRVKATNSEI